MAAISAQALLEVMDQFVGGIDGRYRHMLNRRFVYTAGVREVAEKAQAYWLLDLMALGMAPLYAKAWLKGEASIGIVALEVAAQGQGAQSQAKATLSLSDELPPAFSQSIPRTDFPPGAWTFFLGTDEVAPDEYVTTVCLPQEY